MGYDMKEKLKKDCMEFMSEGTVEPNGWKPKNCRIHNYTDMYVEQNHTYLNGAFNFNLTVKFIGNLYTNEIRSKFTGNF